ncbi:MAG: NAD(P)H-quinone oxidoreductase subunit I [Candidatus Dichloromethanomonas elyunquensis]|nr:MAG: NAD(P)H-quinone oxidoreductase subunit I [Candidatus Dichloromethanomonas elyunquensis]
MYGSGLLKGLSITIKHFFEKKITQQYPEERPALPKRFRGSFELIPSKCIVCSLCSNACPNNIISIQSKKDENNKKKLTGYQMMMGSCLYCGFCVEVCPTGALYITQKYENAVFFRQNLNVSLFKDEPEQMLQAVRSEAE